MSQSSRAFMESGDLCIEIQRKSGIVKQNFGESFVDILRCKNDKIRQFLKLEGPPEKDGFTYFIRARPSDVSQKSFAIQISIKEASDLCKALNFLKCT